MEIIFSTSLEETIVMYILANRGTTASDINSPASVTSGAACPNLSENRSRGNSGRDIRKGDEGEKGPAGSVLSEALIIEVSK